MLAMVFVNDIAGAAGLPWWMYHYATTSPAPDYNGLTFVDWVFPAFLFVMGMSIPAALQARIERGEPSWRIVLHVLARGGSLLLLGFFKINQTGSIAALGWGPGVWNVLMFLAAIATFTQLRNLKATIIVRAIGAAGLLALAFIHFRFVGPMTPKWWDILGIIGWAYLAACMVWAATRNSPAGMTAAVAVLLYLFVLESLGVLAGPTILGVTLSEHLRYGSTIGTHAAIAVCGMILASRLVDAKADREHLKFFAAAAVAMLVASVATYPKYGINKDLATPAWAMLCAAATVLVFVPLWWWTDRRGGVGSSWLLRTAGRHALLIYLLQSMLYPLIQVMTDAFSGRLAALVSWYAKLGQIGDTAVYARGAGLAVVLTLFAWSISRAGARLKL